MQWKEMRLEHEPMHTENSGGGEEDAEGKNAN